MLQLSGPLEGCGSPSYSRAACAPTQLHTLLSCSYARYALQTAAQLDPRHCGAAAVSVKLAQATVLQAAVMLLGTH